MRHHPRALVATLALALGAGALGGCALLPQDTAIRAATPSPYVALDPVASADDVTRTLSAQLYPVLLERDPIEGMLELSLADSAEWAKDGSFVVTLPEGLSFANGDALTSSDIVFSVQRMREIGTGSWPAAAFAGLESVEAVDEQTVVFHLRRANDQSFPSALAGPAGAIVDEEIFAADEITPDADIVAGQPFAGDYVVDDTPTTSGLRLVPNPAVTTDHARAEVQVSFHADASSLASRLRDGDLDLVWGPVGAEARAELAEIGGATAVWRADTELRWLVFDLATQPFGRATDARDEAKATAVRLAAADVVDRAALAAQDPTRWLAWAGYLPESLGGDPAILSGQTGDGEGGPAVERAAKRLSQAGVKTPVALRLGVALGGKEAPDAVTSTLVGQLEQSGLFEVEIDSVEGTFGRRVLSQAHYPAYDHAWAPLGVDPEDVLLAAYGPDNVLANNASTGSTASAIAAVAAAADAKTRATKLRDAQRLLAARAATIPLLEGIELAYSGPRVTGGGFNGRGVLDFATFLRP